MENNKKYYVQLINKLILKWIELLWQFFSYSVHAFTENMFSQIHLYKIKKYDIRF